MDDGDGEARPGPVTGLVPSQCFIRAAHSLNARRTSTSEDDEYNKHAEKQEAQLSQRGRAMLRVTEYLSKSLKIIQGHSK